MQRPSGKILFLVVGGFFALLGLDCTAASVQMYRREKAFEHALTTSGIIAEKHTENTSSNKTSRRSYTECLVAANYKIGKHWYRIEQSVSDSVYQSAQVGSPIQIFYRASDPSDGVLRKPSHEWIPTLIGIPGFILGLIAIVIALRGGAPG